MGSCLDHSSGRLVCSPSCGVRFNHVKLFVVYHCRCVGVTWMVSCSVRMVQYLTRLYIYVMPTRMEETPKVALDIHCLRRGGGVALTLTIN